MCRRRCKDLLDSCSECERERAAYVEERYEFDLLCQTNPELDPSWKPATEEEYRAWFDYTTSPHGLRQSTRDVSQRQEKAMPHSSGPWIVTGPNDEPYGDISVGPKGRRVCALWQDDAPVHDYNERQWANAHLISAAPDLFTVLTYWLHVIEDQEGKSDETDTWVDKARAALAKAMGEKTPA